MRALLLVFLSSITAVLGQLSLKVGMDTIGPIGVDHASPPLGTLLQIVTVPAVMIGLALYAVSAMAWLIVLSHLRLSYAYPFLALNFVLVTVASRLFLQENVPPWRWVGILVICLGILIASRS